MPKKFKNISEEELDKLFSESAEKFNPPSAPEGAWDDFFVNKLSPNKEREKKGHKNFGSLFPSLRISKRSWQFVSLSAILLISFIWFGTEKWSAKNTPIKNTVASVSNEQNKNSAVPDIYQNKSTQLPNSSNVTSNFVLNESNSSFDTNKKQQSTTAFANNYPANQIIRNHIFIENNLIRTLLDKSSILNLINTNKYNVKPQNTYAEQNINNAVQDSANSFLRNKPFVPLNDKGEFVMNDDGNDKKKTSNDANWQFGLVGGSNLSVAGGNVSNSPGLNTGAMIQRRIGKSRFSVETGVVRESMSYAVGNNDFHPNGNNVSSDVSNIRGNCTMVDVPVNVRYDVVHSKKSSAFVSTGISTMWMANQSYAYQYADNGTATQVSKDVSGQGKSVYAVTNVSIGFEQHFKKTSVQLAPYIKIPLGSIGYGNLNLGSVGAQISIKQNF
ncbi:MAG TPA: hypothetical protein VGB84_07340 [Arachidicoccus sp.]